MKLAITVARDVHEDVVRAARDQGVSVSAWMTAAARRALRIRDGLAAVGEWEAAHGVFTELEMEEAREQVLSKHGRARRRARRSRSR